MSVCEGLMTDENTDLDEAPNSFRSTMTQLPLQMKSEKETIWLMILR